MLADLQREIFSAQTADTRRKRGEDRGSVSVVCVLADIGTVSQTMNKPCPRDKKKTSLILLPNFLPHLYLFKSIQLLFRLDLALHFKHPCL